MEGRQKVLEESRRKGLWAGAASVGAVATAWAATPTLAVIAAVPAAVLAVRWWQHRAENGIKF